MQYVIEQGIPGLESMRFGVDLKKLTKSTKNRSYPNLSDCCSKVLKQKKFCSGCGTEVSGSTKRKLFKLAKEEFQISTEHLKQIKDSLDSISIVIKSYVDKSEIDNKYFGGLFHLGQTKQKKEYAELLNALEISKLVGVGTFTFKNRPYPFMLYPKNGHLMLRALHFEEEISEMTEIENTAVNEEKIKLIAGIQRLKAKSFNISNYINIREEQEQEIISKVIAGEKLPEVETVILEQVASDDLQEIEKLKAILVAQ